MLAGQIELEEVLSPDCAVAVGTRPVDESLGSVQPDGQVAETGKACQIAARTTAKVESREGCLAGDMAQQGGNVLTQVVLAGSLAEVLGALVVMRQCPGRDLFEIVGE